MNVSEIFLVFLNEQTHTPTLHSTWLFFFIWPTVHGKHVVTLLHLGLGSEIVLNNLLPISCV